MSWTVSKLNVDFNDNRATVVLDSNTAPSNSITMNFTMPDATALKKPHPNAAQLLDNVTRAAVIGQVKTILADAADSL